MPLPTLYNTRTTTVDLSTAMFADSANTHPVSPAGVATSSSVSLYQSGDPINEDAMTYALIPLKIDLTGCDTIEFSFKYNRGTYAPNIPDYQGMELGLVLNAGDFANFIPKNHQDSNDLLGIGGALYVSYPFHDGADNQWQLLSAMPPRTGYATGANFTPSEIDLYNFDNINDWLSAGAYDGTSTLTLRVQFQKVQTGAGDTANGIPGGSGQTITAIATWIAENGQVLMQPETGNPSLFHLDVATPDNTAAYDVLGSPNTPVTVTPYFRRLTFHDTAGNPQTVSDLSITVGSSTKPVFWTDLQGCAEG